MFSLWLIILPLLTQILLSNLFQYLVWLVGTVTISYAIRVPGTIPSNPFRCIHQYWAQQNWWALLHTQGGPYEELWGASFMQLCPAHTSCFSSPWSLNSVSTPQKACQALLGSSCCVMAWKPNVIIWVKSRVYLFCFSSLKDRCPLMPDAQSLWKVLFQIFCVCVEGGRVVGWKKRRIASVGRINAILVTPSWPKSRPKAKA